MDARRHLAVLLCLASSVLATGCARGVGQSTPPVGTDSAARAPAAVRASAVTALGSYNIDPRKVFVAGISSGGFFAVQMHVAHSDTIRGAAIYAGGVYYCALDNVITALTNCGGADSYVKDIAASEAYLDQQSAMGTIDNESHLRGEPVYLWSGTRDATVKHDEMNDLDTEYKHYGANVVRYDNAFPAGHGWESPNGQLHCEQETTPFMISCRKNGAVYDSEQVWMSAFFGPLQPRHGTPAGSLINFDQTAFGANASNSMDTNGYVFVPNSCAQGRSCGLVTAFHGCLQTQADIGTTFVTEAGIDEWADGNGIIVLYPYAVKSATVPFNPNGCWDWWGYDDPNYALKSGTQVSIVYSMMRHLMGH